MKLTCLATGSGSYHSSASHLLELDGFWLLDCPLNLSALAAFFPIPLAADSHMREASSALRRTTSLRRRGPSPEEVAWTPCLCPPPQGCLASPSSPASLASRAPRFM